MEKAELCFLNRDHIVFVIIQQDEILMTTAAGRDIRIPATPAMIARFADELANDIQSNFVSIARPPQKNRFVDNGPEFITVVESESK